MTPYEEAARLLMTPLGPVAIGNTVGMLREAAFNGEFAAAKALAAVVGRQLRLKNWELLFGSDSPEELLTANEIPELARFYALGFVPRVLLLTPPLVTQGLHEGENVAAFRIFRQLTRHHSFLSDEALRAILVHLFITILSRESGSCRWSRALYAIMRDAKIVTGDTVNTNFEFGQDLIECVQDIHGLASLVFYLFELYRSDLADLNVGPAIGGNEDVEALRQIVLITMQQARDGGDAKREFDRSQDLPSGSRVIWSGRSIPGSDQLLFHISISASGGPIDFPSAATLAWICLQLAGQVFFNLTAAYSAAGIFHLAFLGNATPGESDLSDSADDLVTAEPGPTAEIPQWLDSLRASDRLVTREADLIARVFNPEIETVEYRSSPGDDVAEALFLSAASQAADMIAFPVDTQIRALDAVLKCANAVGLHVMLAGGISVASAADSIGVGLNRIGTLAGIVQAPDESNYFGATSAGVRGVLAELIDAGVNIDEPLAEDGSTLLMNAACRSPDFAAQLIAGGADVNRCNQSGESPLILAAAHGQEEVVRQLLAAGAAVDAADGVGRTSVASALTPEIAALLCVAGADPNASDHAGLTALIHAVSAGAPQLVTELLRQGADPDRTCEAGMTAMHYAMSLYGDERREQIVASLAAFDAKVDVRAGDGQTPAMMAATRGFADTVKQLAGLGANVSAAGALLRSKAGTASERDLLEAEPTVHPIPTAEGDGSARLS